MNDFIAGPTSGSSEDGAGPWSGGTPPPVLLAAMGAAVLIAVTLVAFLIGSSGGAGDSRAVPAGAVGVDDPDATGATASAVEKRVLLSVSVEGGGSGKVRIAPLDVTCSESCEHEFTTGTRVRVSADAASGSRFEGWEDACSGIDSCSFFMDRERSLTATFEGKPTTPQCEDGRDNDDDGFTDEADPGCRADSTEAPDDRAAPAGDCADGRDNDGDGLIDTAQDPGCEGDDTEVDGASAPPPSPPAPPAPATTTSAPVTSQVSECHDGRDNDGDGEVDRPADPGCDADGTEAGG